MLNRLALAILSTALLMAFAPGDTTSRVQQPPPKTWIPPTRDTAPPPVITQPETFISTPETCKAPQSPAKVSEAFATSYARASTALRAGDWAQALASANNAAPAAGSRRELEAATAVKLAAATGLSDKPAAIAALETLIPLSCEPAQAARYRQQLDDLRRTP